MRRWLAVVALAIVCAAPLRADVTISQTMTVEGGAAAMMGGAKPMVIVTRIKGMKARADMDVMDVKMSTLTDVEKKEVILLNHAEKTAQMLSATSPMSTPPGPMPSVDVSVKPTGQSKAIDGHQCDEHAFTMTIGMAEMSGGQMPPEAAAAMKDLRIVMNGSAWVVKTGPGTADFIAFQKAAADAKLMEVLGGAFGGAQRQGGLDKLMGALSSISGMPYLTEMTMTFEGTGPIADMLQKKMSGMKMTQKTTAISTDAVPDDLFQVPADYKTDKK